MTKKEDTNMERTQVEARKTDVHRYHKKFPNALPFQNKKLRCHFEPENTSELETQTQLETHPKKR